MEAQVPVESRLGGFFRRNGRVISIIGTLIVFATFVVKDALREQLKDLKDSLESAQNFYTLRDENAKLSEQVAKLSSTVDGVKEEVNDVYEMQTSKHPEATLTLNPPTALGVSDTDVPDIDRALELVRRMPNHKNDEATLSEMRKRLEAVRDKAARRPATRIRDADAALEYEREQLTAMMGDAAAKTLMGDAGKPASHEAEEQGKEEKAEFEEAFKIGYNAHSLITGIVSSAELQADQDERRYQLCTYIAYALYALGWGLTLAGRVFNIESLVAEE